MSVTSLLKSILRENDMPVTFGVTSWHEDGAPITQAAIDRVTEVMRADASQGRAGNGRIRPSLIGDDCARKHMLSFIGAEQEPPTVESLNIMNAGTWGHYRWQVAGLSAGWLQDIEVKVGHLPWYLSGSMDGILSDGTGFELKTINGFGYSKVMKDGPKYEHLMQTHAYMQSLDIDTFSIVYEHRENLSWREFRVTKQQSIMDDLNQMMDRLVGHIEGETLPDMLPECMQLKGKKYEWCNWKFSCPAAKFHEAV